MNELSQSSPTSSRSEEAAERSHEAEAPRRRIGQPSRRRRLIVIVLTATAAVACYLLLPPAIDELQRRMIAIFLVAAVFWATEALPLFATSLLVIAFEVLCLAEAGGLADRLPAIAAWPDERTIAFSTFLRPWGSNVLILFMGGFLLAAALTRHQIDRAIAARVLRPFTRSPLLLIYGILGITAFFSMWMSNTATAAMMLAIITPVLRQIPPEQRFSRGVVLAVPFGANIGGLGTPIGTPPNAVAFAAINDHAGVFNISFVEWVILGTPLALLLLLGVGLLLYAVYRPTERMALGAIEAPERIGRRGYLTLAILGAAIALWLTSGQHGLKSGVIALFAAAALAAFGVLGRDDIDAIDWHILILMWGGLALGEGIAATGLTDLIGAVDFTALPGGEWVIAAGVVVVSLGLSTVMSNTATANLMVPITLALAVGAAETRGELAVLTAFACSFAMAMPVSTPPNAVAFATGRIPAVSLLRLGGLVSIVSAILLLVGYQIMFGLILGTD
jgi:sodium-dependent dicarboxylate transporter 2/3/5